MYKVWDKVKIVIPDMQLCVDWIKREVWQHIYYWIIWTIILHFENMYWVNWINNMVKWEYIYKPTQEELNLYYNEL